MRDREFQKRRLFVTLLLAAVIIVFPQATFSQITTPQAQFIIGPQVPISNSWFDKTEVARAKAHGEAFPAEPPSPMTDEYIFGNYYDLALTEYIAYQRAGDPAFLGYARKVADSCGKGSACFITQHVCPRCCLIRCRCKAAAPRKMVPHCELRIGRMSKQSQ